MDSTTSQIIKCGSCGCPLHVTSATGFCSALCEREAAQEASHLANARYLGADAAMAAASWVTMDESDARSILTDVDPEVMDRYEAPNLSGEMAGESIPEIFSDFDDPWDESLHDAWEEGRDAVWSDALQATALRVLGDIPKALQLEADIEAYVSALRNAAR